MISIKLAAFDLSGAHTSAVWIKVRSRRQGGAHRVDTRLHYKLLQLPIRQASISGERSYRHKCGAGLGDWPRREGVSWPAQTLLSTSCCRTRAMVARPTSTAAAIRLSFHRSPASPASVFNRMRTLVNIRAEGHVGVTAADNRLFVEAVLYRYRTGMPWRDLPERFGDWKNVHQRFSPMGQIGCLGEGLPASFR
jgi:Putative transposase of IS4/5 family (DUF4096)